MGGAIRPLPLAALLLVAMLGTVVDGECYNACPYGRRMNSCRCLDRESITTCEWRNCRPGYHCLVINGEARCKPNREFQNTAEERPNNIDRQPYSGQNEAGAKRSGDPGKGDNSATSIFLVPSLLIASLLLHWA